MLNGDQRAALTFRTPCRSEYEFERKPVCEFYVRLSADQRCKIVNAFVGHEIPALVYEIARNGTHLICYFMYILGLIGDGIAVAVFADDLHHYSASSADRGSDACGADRLAFLDIGK